MKKFLLIILLASVLFLCSGCTDEQLRLRDEQLGYRAYPYVVVYPSFRGNSIKSYIPLDGNDYLYHSCDFENTENGIDMIIHFSKKGN